MSDTISKKVKTRKVHMCWGCCDTIPYASTVERLTTFDDGTVVTCYYCDWCKDILLKTPVDFYEYDGIASGDCKEWFKDYPEHYKGIKEKEANNA